MAKYVLVMLIPLYITIYTVQFGRWMHQKRMVTGAVSAYVVAVFSLTFSGWVFWRLFS